MAAERQIPGGPFLNEVGTAQRQIPGGPFANETVSAGGGAVTVDTGVGQLTVTGNAPTADTKRDITTAAGVLTITGNAPTVSTALNVQTQVGELTVTGNAPAADTRRDVTTIAGQLTITGNVPVVNNEVIDTVQTFAGALTIVGNAPAITLPKDVTTAAGALTVAGYVPTVRNDLAVQTIAGTLTVTGNVPTLDLSAALNVSTLAGQIVIDGYAPTVSGGTTTFVHRDTGAGASRKRLSRRKRKPILVEIDGEQFVVRSEHEAVELLDKAEESARQVAEQQAAEILSKRTKKSRKSELNTAPLRLDEPQITVRPLDDGAIDKQWLASVQVEADRIRQAFKEVSQKYETMLLLNYKEQLDEEDALVALLFTI